MGYVDLKCAFFTTKISDQKDYSVLTNVDKNKKIIILIGFFYNFLFLIPRLKVQQF